MWSMLRPRMTFRTSLIFVAIVACALALARQPIVWDLLDATRVGNLMAGLRYFYLWVGLTLAVFLGRSPASRMVAYGWVLVGSVAIPLFFSHTDLGIEPDFASYFNRATIMAVCVFWLAAGIMWGVKSRNSMGSDRVSTPSTKGK